MWDCTSRSPAFQKKISLTTIPIYTPSARLHCFKFLGQASPSTSKHTPLCGQPCALWYKLWNYAPALRTAHETSHSQASGSRLSPSLWVHPQLSFLNRTTLPSAATVPGSKKRLEKVQRAKQAKLTLRVEEHNWQLRKTLPPGPCRGTRHRLVKNTTLAFIASTSLYYYLSFIYNPHLDHFGSHYHSSIFFLPKLFWHFFLSLLDPIRHNFSPHSLWLQMLTTEYFTTSLRQIYSVILYLSVSLYLLSSFDLPNIKYTAQ